MAGFAAALIVRPPGLLILDGRPLRCALGRGGIGAKTREGDGMTPVGEWPLRAVWFRADRLGRPVTGLPARPIEPADGWCDDPARPEYNRPVRRPFAGSHERLWRDDGLYDALAEVGFNDAPPLAGRGSAIFLHVARPDYGPTAGCVALARADLLAVLERCGPATRLRIESLPA